MALFTSIGLALGFSAAAATGLTAFGAGVAAVSLAGAAAYKAMDSRQQSKKTANATRDSAAVQKAAMEADAEASARLANAPAEAENRAKGRLASRKKQAGVSVRTSPLGLAGEANVARKTLLGS